MTDRELLELAAKAAGIFDEHEEVSDCTSGGFWLCDSGKGYQWNPLTNDGDALGLAVKLHLTIRVWISAVIIEDNKGNRLAFEDTGCRAHEYEKDATRRAIVRAAAAIGEGMK